MAPRTCSYLLAAVKFSRSVSPSVLGSMLKKTPSGFSARRTARNTVTGSPRSWMQSWLTMRSKVAGSMSAMSAHRNVRFVSPGLLAFARSIDRWSRSMPSTLEAGKAFASAKATAPAPVPRSATLMPDFSRSTISGRDFGNHERARELLIPGPLLRSMPRLNPHSLCWQKGTPMSLSGSLVALTTPGIARYRHGTSSNQPAPKRSKSSFARTSDCAGSKANPSTSGLYARKPAHARQPQISLT
mmetsp:Transcript_23258/g.73210  ORF Transcript_23258/g.73210 Transcript_23258/m.73210 type:complete len:243 (+) Transcript_23258:86-814(+)